jgi:hypothetical protein
MLATALWISQARAAVILNPGESVILARAFAPTLVFHPDEQYFPVSPLFPIDPHQQPVAGDRAVTEDLGTPVERLRRYEQLRREDQFAQAALAYRVFPTIVAGRQRIAVEYWCHYVFNRYRFHGGIVQWSAPDNHHNDLERVVFILERQPDEQGPVSDVDSARRAYIIRRIIASAHDGSINANVLDVDPGRPVRPPVALLVENGSHAMAPDVDDDGRVTIGVDVNATGKFLWGIRDHGEGGARYRASFTDDRTLGSRLCGPEDSSRDHRCIPYLLQPAEPLQAWFDTVGITPSVRDRMIGQTAWLVRWFGDANIEELMIPQDRVGDGVITRMTNCRAIRESGLSIGTTLGDEAHSLAVGGRWAWVTPGRLIPDVLATGHALVGAHGLSGFDASLIGFYQLDVITKVVFGLTWTDPHHEVGGRPWDVLVGVEFRMGRLRVRPNTTLRGALRGTELSLLF